MVYRVLFTLTTGFALFSGSVCVGQVEIPAVGSLPENGAVAGQTNSQVPPSADTQPSNTSDSTAIARWWQRFTPPTTASGQPANGAETTVAPAPQSTSNATGSTWYFGKLFKGSDKKSEQTDPFAVKRVSYEEANPNPTVLAAESSDPAKCALTPPPGQT